MKTHLRTWRIRGVPRDFRKKELEAALRVHPALKCAADGESPDGCDNGARVHTLAIDLRPIFQVATVRFSRMPRQLETCTSQLTIELPIPVASQDHTSQQANTDQQSDAKQRRGSDAVECATISLDDHFDGLTVLYSNPLEKNDMDVLALSGLGSHPWGSFMDREHGNMWLCDNLRRDFPSARVILYGYNTTMVGSTSFADLEALASSLHSALTQLLRSSGQTPLALVAHSLGGLLVKEAMIKISESRWWPELLQQIVAILFFGVPHNGLNIESLIPMVDHQPNDHLLWSIDRINSQVLRFQERGFEKVVETLPNMEMYCFYEDVLSHTAVKDSGGVYKMDGPLECLVTKKSATSCLLHGSSSEFAIAIERNHSDLVKFPFHDAEYDKVAYILRVINERCIGVQLSGSGASQFNGRVWGANKLKILRAVCGVQDVTQTLRERIENEVTITIFTNEIDRLTPGLVYKDLPSYFVKNLSFIYQYGDGPMRICSINHIRDSANSIQITAKSEHTVVTARPWSKDTWSIITVVYGGKVFNSDVHLRNVEEQIRNDYKNSINSSRRATLSNDTMGEDPWPYVIKTGAIFFRATERGPIRAAAALEWKGLEWKGCSLIDQPQLTHQSPLSDRSQVTRLKKEMPGQVNLYHGLRSSRYTCILEAGDLSVNASTDPFLTFGDGVQFVYQTDGNFVVYRDDGGCLWSANEHGPDAGRHLRFQDDGNLVLYGDGYVMWKTDTHDNPGARLVLSNMEPYIQIFRNDGVKLFSA